MNNEYYIERQKKWIDEVGLKVGDKVMLVGDPDPWRDCHGLGSLAPEHRRSESYYVQDIEEDLIVLDDSPNSPSGNFFPFYVLLKINE